MVDVGKCTPSMRFAWAAAGFRGPAREIGCGRAPRRLRHCETVAGVGKPLIFGSTKLGAYASQKVVASWRGTSRRVSRSVVGGCERESFCGARRMLCYWDWRRTCLVRSVRWRCDIEIRWTRLNEEVK